MIKKLFLLLVLTFSLVTVLGYRSDRVEALSGSDFQAGRIIDDGMFYNGKGLMPLQIQAFLDAKVPTCDTYHARSSSPNDSGAPYTCLKDYRQDTWSIAGDAYCNGFSGGNKSAAEIIYEVGVSCGINQKVILITLQKEQSFITDTWPWAIQYTKATGFGCPDNPPANWPNGCDPNYAGFFKQVYYGARQFKRYAQDTNIFTSYRPYRNNFIGYNPNGGCSGSNVYIQNQATSSLYIYTPYQPNAAALNNLYGTGDGCSAYGNRNFWRMFNEWFGTTYSDLFSATYHGQGPTPSIYPGETKTSYIEFKNNGNWDWHDDGMSWPGIPPVHLAATRDINRASIFSYGWPSAGRPNLMFSKVFENDGVTLAANQHLVKPGQVARFEFKVTAPWTLQPGVYREHFQPVLEGSDAWNIGGLAWFDIDVKPRYQATFHSQSAYPKLNAGESKPMQISYRNTGGDWWYDDVSRPNSVVTPIHLAATRDINRASIFSYGWPSAGRPAVVFARVYEANGTTLSAEQHIVKPNQIARFEFNVTAPWTLQPGVYREHFQPVAEGASNWQMQGLSWLDVSR